MVRRLREGARGGGELQGQKKCEGCGLKGPYFGLPSDER